MEFILSGAARLITLWPGRIVLSPGAALHPHWKTTRFSRWQIQCLWAVLLTLSGKYATFWIYVIFAVLLF